MSTSQKSCLTKRVEALRSVSPDGRQFENYSRAFLNRCHISLKRLGLNLECHKAENSGSGAYSGSEAYIAQRSPTFGTVLDKFIADERLKEIKARRPGEIVDEGLKFSTTTAYLSVIKLHLRPAWGKVPLSDINHSPCKSG